MWDCCQSLHSSSPPFFSLSLDYFDFFIENEVTQLGAINGYCFTPSASSISSSSITNATADISIPNSGTYDLAYHKEGEPFANATILNNITTGSVTLSSLEEFTTYSVYIREVCSGNTTGWSTAQDSPPTRPIGRIYGHHAATGNNKGM